MERYILLIISPVLGVMVYFKNINFLKSDLAFLFGIFGFLFAIPSEGHDSYRYYSSFLSLHELSIGQFVSSYLLVFWENRIDFIVPLMFYIIGFISTSKVFFFTVLGIVLGLNVYALGKSIENRLRNEKVMFIFHLLIIGLIVFIPFFMVNHFRWYLGLTLMSRALLETNRNRFVAFGVFSILTHISFAVVFPLFILFRYVKINSYFLLALLLVSFFVKISNTSLVNQISFIESNEYLLTKSKGYTEEGYLNELVSAQENRKFLVQYRQEITRFGLIGLILSIIFYSKKYRLEDNPLINLVIAVLILSNLLDFSYVFYNRLSHIALVFSLFMIASLRYSLISKSIVWIALISLITFEFMFVLRIGIDYYDIYFLFPLAKFFGYVY